MKMCLAEKQKMYSKNARRKKQKERERERDKKLNKLVYEMRRDAVAK